MSGSGVSGARSKLVAASFLRRTKKAAGSLLRLLPFRAGVGFGFGFGAYALRLSHRRKDDGGGICREEDGAFDSVDLAS